MLGLLAAGWAVIYADRTVLYPLLSIIAVQLSLSSADAGLLTGSYFFAYLLMQIPAGIFGDRFGMRKMLIVMYGVAAVGITGLAVGAGNFPAMLAFMALHGLGAGAYYPASLGMLMQKTPPEKRAFSSSLIGVGMSVGMLCGLTAGGVLYEIFQDIRAPIVVLAIPTLCMAVMMWKYVPDTEATPSPSWSQYKAILTDWDLWRINLSTLTSLYGFWVALTWGPTFLKFEKGFSLGAAGFYTGLIALSTIPASMFWGRMADRLGRKKVAAFVLPASAVALFLLTKADGQLTVIGVMILYGMFANSAFVPSMLAWSGDIVEARHPGMIGASVGLFNGTIMTSAVIAPIVSGMLRDRTGSLETAIIAACGLMILGTLLMLTIPAKPRRIH